MTKFVEKRWPARPQNAEVNHDNRNESLTDAEIAQLARKLFGPEEEWDDAAAVFVLKLFGIDIEDEPAYGIKLLNKVILRMRERGKEVPQPMLTLLAKLEQKPKKNVTG